MSGLRVSVVVPVKDGAATLPALLDAVHRQRIDAEVEMVAVDSGSTDGSVPLLQRHGVREVITIAPGAFDHGITRNLGVERSRGELVVLIVQDAIPVSDGWLAALVEPLRSDPGVAGAFARQIPRADASGIARHYLSLWVAAGQAPHVVSLSGQAELDAMTPSDRLRHCAFDNVCSCVRRSVWQRYPFRPTPIAEDLAWARDVLLAGHRIAFAPGARVEHSHDRSLTYEFGRTRDLHRMLFELFGLQTIPTWRHLARAVAVSAAVNLRCEAWHPRRAPRAIGLAVVWPLGQYLGARHAARGSGWPPQEAGACAS